MEEAIAGAKDIIAERISDSAELRKDLREIFVNNSNLATIMIPRVKTKNNVVFKWRFQKKWS